MTDRDNSKSIVWNKHVSKCNVIWIFIEPRGFGFVTFNEISSVEAVMAETNHYVDGKLVECKRAVPKEMLTTEKAAAEA